MFLFASKIPSLKIPAIIVVVLWYLKRERQWVKRAGRAEKLRYILFGGIVKRNYIFVIDIGFCGLF